MLLTNCCYLKNKNKNNIVTKISQLEIEFMNQVCLNIRNFYKQNKQNRRKKNEKESSFFKDS